MKAARTVSVYLTVVLTSQTLALAQNPLRAAPQDTPPQRAAMSDLNAWPEPTRAWPEPTRDLNQYDDARRLQAPQVSQQISSQGFATPPATQFDGTVVSASFNQPTPSQHEPPQPIAAAENPSAAGLLGALGGGSMDHNKILD